MAAASPAPAPKDWAALPSDLLWRVFAAAGQEEILRGAGLACSAWRRAARDEPALWRRIDLHSDVAAHGADSSFSDDDDDDGDSDGYSVPVDDGSRSDALVEESDSNDAENNGDDAASVQSNHSSDDDDFGFSDAFVDVEESDDDDDVPRKESADYKAPEQCIALGLKSAMKSCIHLKSFAIRCADKSLASTYYHDDESQEAFTVPKKHGLRSLTLFGDTFTKPIILSVLNCCPKLRSLDVTNVAYLRMDEVEELRNKCLKIKDFRLFSPPPKVSSSESDDDCIGGCCCCDSWY
uniref:F-box domain-containing protein n=1 Tax=Oryza glumipatula TaxID=40148 RepID=A0A0E0BSI2_9ORYZ